VVEHLLCKSEALNSNPSPPKTNDNGMNQSVNHWDIQDFRVRRTSICIIKVLEKFVENFLSLQKHL
jgi:hypothetical protein